MSIGDLTAGQQERIRSCATPEELAELADREGIELSDEELEALVGGMKIVPVKSSKIVAPILRTIADWFK